MDLGALRAARITDNGNLVLEFWEAKPADADIMTWFAGNTVRVVVDPISVTVEDSNVPMPLVAAAPVDPEPEQPEG